MSLQIRFGIFGAALGLLIGLIGSIVAGVPFGILLLRTLVATVIAGGLGFLLHIVLSTLLPDLLPGSEASTNPEFGPEVSSGPRVDISVGDDHEAVETHAGSESEDGSALPATPFDEAASDGSIMEELSDGSNPSVSGEGNFSEDAFYAGVDRLPDIGGLSQQFASGENSSEQATFEESSTVGVSSSSSSSKSGGKSSGMDPALVAQAIRTALKKEES